MLSLRERRWSRGAGLAYIANIGLGSWAAIAASRGDSGMSALVNAVAAVSYVVVTILLYRLFLRQNARLAVISAGFSLAGCLISLVQVARPEAITVSPLPLFGVYCLLIGLLVAQSGFPPRWIGIALMVGGLGWLTFAWPELRRDLFPWNMAPAILAETALALTLLRVGFGGGRPPALAD